MSCLPASQDGGYGNRGYIISMKRSNINCQESGRGFRKAKWRVNTLALLVQTVRV